MIVVGFEAIAGAKIIQYWINIPLWLSALVLLILMTATNLFSVSSFGEFEFWFAGIKVAAIVVFIALGSLFVLGLWPHKSMDFSNLWSHGGFFPLGVGRDHRRGGHGDLLDGGGGDRDDRRRGIFRPGEGGGQGRQLGDPADCDLLRRLDIPAGDDPAVERRETCRLPVRLRVHRDGDSVCRSHHERGGVDGGAELPELGDVHRLAHAVCFRRAPRRRPSWSR